MSNRLHVGTRKGLFELARSNGVWEIVDVRFLGDPVSAVLADDNGSVWAALDLGHFGAKLWRRDGAGDWREMAVPVFPPKPEPCTPRYRYTRSSRAMPCGVARVLLSPVARLMTMVGVAQLAERQVVVLDVVGSSPITHPML